MTFSLSLQRQEPVRRAPEVIFRSKRKLQHEIYRSLASIPFRSSPFVFGKLLTVYRAVADLVMHIETHSGQEGLLVRPC